MDKNSDGEVALPAAQPNLTPQARKRLRQKMNRRATVEGRALLKSKQQKRNKKRPKRHSTPNQKRKQIALAKKQASLAEKVAGPETPPQLSPSSDPFSKVPGDSDD
ncbi:hypothetical protein ABBQ38_013209 [Trebouxia sp. C0009 RCD-2024]